MANVVNISVKISTKYRKMQRNWHSSAPVRPIVLIQSDDWGRVGIPEVRSLEALQRAGFPVGKSPWDYYGLESDDDLSCLGNTLSRHKDVEGNPACVTANIIMANADLTQMKAEEFSHFRYVSIDKGFPEPWESFNVLASYKRLTSMGVFYPALHGFTHFSPDALLLGWHNKGEFGNRVRSLIQYDIPYLASLTPEFNFALMPKLGNEMKFLNETDQRLWIQAGVRLFNDSFGFLPVSTCAPGYRANQLTHRLWSEHGLKVAQTSCGGVIYRDEGLLFIPRTVFFEPALGANTREVVSNALAQACRAVKQGKMIVICSHSINYIQRSVGRRDESLCALDSLLTGLLKLFPNLRFANDKTVLEAWSNMDEAVQRYL
jgi:hypothetical protein